MPVADAAQKSAEQIPAPLLDATDIKLYEPLQGPTPQSLSVRAIDSDEDEERVEQSGTQVVSTSTHVVDDAAQSSSLQLLKKHLASSLETSYCSLTTKVNFMHACMDDPCRASLLTWRMHTCLATQAAGLRHIGFGPMGMPLKRENQVTRL